MERQIGEIFDYEGKKLQVVEQVSCKGCVFFKGESISCEFITNETTGRCCGRKDGKYAIYKAVTEQEQEEQANAAAATAATAAASAYEDISDDDLPEYWQHFDNDEEELNDNANASDEAANANATAAADAAAESAQGLSLTAQGSLPLSTPVHMTEEEKQKALMALPHESIEAFSKLYANFICDCEAVGIRVTGVEFYPEKETKPLHQ